MAGRFQGFAQEGLDFLQQVRIENDKTWFEEHRFIYDRSVCGEVIVSAWWLSGERKAMRP